MLPKNLPIVDGIYEFKFPLYKLAFFKVGGSCDVLFTPADENDLVNFLSRKSADLPITILGNMSNVLISDAGIRGCVLRLSKLSNITFFDGYVEVGAGATLPRFINCCMKKEISCLEKLFCVPGSMGGAVSMNAGVPGFEVSAVLLSVSAVSIADGKKQIFSREDLHVSYRNGGIPPGVVVTSAKLRTVAKSCDEIYAEIRDISERRKMTQPIGMPTCGSTFKNPPGRKAWQLIKEAGCDSLSVGGARVSEKHCNFLINSGNATAADFVELINKIKARVLAKTGILLQEEIRRMGFD